MPRLRSASASASTEEIDLTGTPPPTTTTTTTRRVKNNSKTQCNKENINANIQPTPEKIFRKTPSHHLHCVICSELFKNPMRAPCGHSYCHECIINWLKIKKSCPIDRSDLRADQLHPDRIVANLIEELDVQCPSYLAGCHWVGPLNELKQHDAKCDFNQRNQPAWLAPLISKSRCDQSPISVSESPPAASSQAPSPGQLPLAARLYYRAPAQRHLLNDIMTGPQATIILDDD